MSEFHVELGDDVLVEIDFLFARSSEARSHDSNAENAHRFLACRTTSNKMREPSDLNEVRGE